MFPNLGCLSIVFAMFSLFSLEIAIVWPFSWSRTWWAPSFRTSCATARSTSSASAQARRIAGASAIAGDEKTRGWRCARGWWCRHRCNMFFLFELLIWIVKLKCNLSYYIISLWCYLMPCFSMLQGTYLIRRSSSPGFLFFCALSYSAWAWLNCINI